MNIYHIARDEEKVDWDEYAGFVVVAVSKREARAFAQEADFRNGAWEDSNYASCKLIGRACSEIASGVVLKDFKG